jgi:hypothetical protein
MMPLHDLVQDNPVDKSPQADAEQNACTLRFPVGDKCIHSYAPRLTITADSR